MDIVRRDLKRCPMCGYLYGWVAELHNGDVPVFCPCETWTDVSVNPKTGHRWSPSMISLRGGTLRFTPGTGYRAADGANVYVPLFSAPLGYGRPPWFTRRLWVEGHATRDGRSSPAANSRVSAPTDYGIAPRKAKAKWHSLRAIPGTYALVLRVDSAARLQIGRRGIHTFPAGWYVYAGSARGPGGVRARVERHLRTHRRPHWHIDYLREAAEVVDVWVARQEKFTEHDVVKLLTGIEGVTVPVKGFGSSDCRAGCEAHLLHCARQAAWRQARTALTRHGEM